MHVINRKINNEQVLVKMANNYTKILEHKEQYLHRQTQ